MDKSEEKKLINSSRSAFFLAGYGVSTLAPLIPILQERFSLDPHELGLLLLCSGIGAFSSMPLAGWLVGRIGCRNMVYAAVALMTCALLSVTLSPAVYLTGALLFFVGMAGVSFGVVVNINAAHVERMIGRSIMSSQHGIYSVGCICGTLAVTFLLGAGLSMSLAEAGALCLYVLVPLIFSRRLLTRAQIAQPRQAPGEGQSAKTSRFGALHPVIICIGMMCYVMYQTEGSMMDWSGVFLKNELHAPVEQAGFGYAAFSIAMTCFRLLGDKIVTACGRRRVLVCGTIGIFIGYSFVVFGGSIYTALLGYFIIGLGAANIVPQLISFSATLKGVSVNGAVTTVNAIGCMGSLMGPAVIGFCAHAFGLGHTFLLQGALVLCVGAGCLWLLRNQKPPVGAVPKGTAGLQAKPGAGSSAASASVLPESASAH
ncbi:MAG: MFS transporter [Proteobacteria bacterium]|uniref:MFS transporter n=1 Tax=Candidatus Avisuccinivibrio stercorigallinarum TaxID=2840704 RepID=A0A9D9GSV2_9GAMM|nr:MFS transporter [Candidatus Avisuccinivibrio stercorigallinarum]